MVEVEGARVLSPACVAQVSEGMKVTTRSERVERSRRTILEMLDSAVDLSEAPEIQIFAKDYGADDSRFDGGARREHPVLDDNPMYIRDYSKCILCWRCVQVCADDAQYTYALSFNGRGFDTGIGTFFDKGMTDTTCVFCGQCVGAAPPGRSSPGANGCCRKARHPTDHEFHPFRAKRKEGNPMFKHILLAYDGPSHARKAAETAANWRASKPRRWCAWSWQSSYFRRPGEPNFGGWPPSARCKASAWTKPGSYWAWTFMPSRLAPLRMRL